VVAGTALEAAGAGEFTGPAVLVFGSQPAIAITATTAAPLRTSQVRCIDVSPMILISGGTLPTAVKRIPSRDSTARVAFTERRTSRKTETLEA
jgi:hypothetical protein